MPELAPDSPRERVLVYGVGFDPMIEAEVLAHVLDELAAGRGGRIVTPNVDILRRARREAEARTHVEAATVVVADGTPLIWASKIAGEPLPARVPGSDLIWSLSGALAGHGRSVYLLGGEPGTAEQAADNLAIRFPGLRVAGHLSPPYGFDTDAEQLGKVLAEVTAAAPDLVFVGLGFPKQERIIVELQATLPDAWFMGCGQAIGFVAGSQPRAPGWMQRAGLEWLHRLGNEPVRLGRRYLVDGVPFATQLLVASALTRLRRRGRAR